jgi:hypothetical protein
MTFIVKKIDSPSRVNIQVAAPCSPPDLVTALAKRQPKQQNVSDAAPFGKLSGVGSPQ